MNKKIKLDIISDVVCPWCIVGYKYLEAAIKELDLQERVEIEWQPFELNPDMPSDGENLRAHVARKYGASAEDSDQARAQIASRGAEYGFKFDYFADMKMVNTFDAHILLEHAKQFDLQTALKLRLFSAFFTEHQDISDRQVLLTEAAKIGLSVDLALFANADLRTKVKDTEAQWQQMGVDSVPTVVFNQQSALTGAHPKETYIQVLTELMAQQNKD
ncbi:thioredoxin [Vibrio sp. UCD-FRSSP16_10]|uniref:DsbA family oxidoreductase n=1 Tax=unclassified Vibrio TaxID=2614977 RepID=UPI0007FFD716|nr:MULTISPECIES: DsbA family oxidoreductase [unclassified Vibrio]OBT13929.1 thioredoxin [Vibrio sp. UCD-FRSSP16_30]OBT22810.1 thioredoxin [Vibrio sp. UCD-FRSSP16_10]